MPNNLVIVNEKKCIILHVVNYIAIPNYMIYHSIVLYVFGITKPLLYVHKFTLESDGFF